jgi:hypothetical protein
VWEEKMNLFLAWEEKMNLLVLCVRKNQSAGVMRCSINSRWKRGVSTGGSKR